MNLEYMIAVKLITKAVEKITDDKLYLRWIINHEHVRYDEFTKLLKQQQVTINKSEEEILNDVKSIIDTFNKGVN